MSQDMTQADGELAPERIAERIVQLAREDYREKSREDTEIELVPGVRVDPAPLTYKGASIEIDHSVQTEVQNALIQAYREHPHLECFSSGDIWTGKYRAWAVKDTERTGGR